MQFFVKNKEELNRRLPDPNHNDLSTTSRHHLLLQPRVNEFVQLVD
jgi:hypothetical protein